VAVTATPGTEPDGGRVVRLLRQLAALTSDAVGAQRVAWTETWHRAREFLVSQLDGIPAGITTDPAGNLWARLPGQRAETVVLGSHLDSVPGGGWLDGAYGVMCAVEVLRILSSGGPPPCSIAVVDWADEEGARFGRSLFGSAAAVGTLDVPAVRGLADRDSQRLEEVLAGCGVDIDQLDLARRGLDGAAAYLEAHIEQGPVLERDGLAVGAVLGTAGVERHRVTFRGQTAHSGATPMNIRRDAVLAAASTALAVRESAIRREGVGTVGSVHVRPDIPTAVAGEAVLLVDQRHQDAGALRAMLEDARQAADAAAAAEGCTVTWETIFSIEPRLFDPRLVAIARGACRDLTGHDKALPSGALHDATEIARVVPTAMIFVSSRGGISHSPEEDTPEEHLKLGLEVYYRTVRRVIDSFVRAAPTGQGAAR
jgi:hydantoinase/carbamoylase family amidase